MIWRRLKFAVLAGTALLLIVVATGVATLLNRGREVAMATAESSLERSAQAIENALNRQLLQVHGALASLPTLFDAAGITLQDTQAAGELLRGLNFQTLAYRDLMLVDREGRILASARPRKGRSSELPDSAEIGREPTALVGPIRNPATGDWSVYVARTIPGWNDVEPIAEVPLLTLTGILAEAGLPPGVKLILKRPNGQLIASLPHDELQTGRVVASPAADAANGEATIVPDGPGRESLLVVRTSLYNGIRLELTESLQAALADWDRDRGEILAAASLGSLLLSAFAAALLIALHQRERTDTERARSQAVLVNAIEAMSDGFIMWDERDRLITCNQRYRDLYRITAPYLVPGAKFEDVVRRGAKEGQYPQAEGDLDAFIAELIGLRKAGRGSIEVLLPDGRWILMRESRTADGGVVGTRTDISALKSTLAELATANERAEAAVAEAQRQNAALVERERHIRFIAHHDDLTLLPNRALFRELIVSSERLAAEKGERLALLYLDLDRFKDVNDTLGHSVGDRLLREVAARLSLCVNDPNRVARLGGDEFAVISIATNQPEDAETLSRCIIEELGRPYRIQGHTISASASVGIALSDHSGADADVLLQQADLALYRAKAQGRGTFRVFTPEMGAHLRDRLEMEADLQLALSEQQFELVYQPIYDLNTERLSGFEALLRWRHPQRGMISPAAFIPLAEDTRLIVDIGNWVLQQAATDALRLPPDLKVAINLSPVQLSIGDIVGAVSEVLDQTRLAPGRLELEITETALFASDQQNLDVLRRLKALGVRIVLDDFGTGYSSLSHLRQFPLDKIKIDRLFVRDMSERPDCVAIVESIAALAARLGMTTTAEGIETRRQWEIARAAGCTEAQGYLLGSPQAFDQALVTATSRLTGREARPA